VQLPSFQVNWFKLPENEKGRYFTMISVVILRSKIR